jgi:hypothetical protein
MKKKELQIRAKNEQRRLARNELDACAVIPQIETRRYFWAFVDKQNWTKTTGEK